MQIFPPARHRLPFSHPRKKKTVRKTGYRKIVTVSIGYVGYLFYHIPIFAARVGREVLLVRRARRVVGRISMRSRIYIRVGGSAARGGAPIPVPCIGPMRGFTRRIGIADGRKCVLPL